MGSEVGSASVGTRYRVVSHLGRGGMGAVLLVEDGVRGERVALKRVLAERAASDSRPRTHLGAG